MSRFIRSKTSFRLGMTQNLKQWISLGLMITLFLNLSFIDLQSKTGKIGSTTKKIHDYQPNSSSLYQEFNATRTYQYIEDQIAFGYRIPGTTANHECAEWISNQMNIYGDSEIIDYMINGISCKNVFSKIPNTKAIDNQIVIFAAHFDTRAVAEKDSDPLKIQDPIDGANDGASGVAVMIELARILSSHIDDFDCEFWFLFFDAEDQGENKGVHGINGWDWCEGSSWQADDMESNPNRYFTGEQSIDTINAFILLDMVGGINLQFTLVSPYNSKLYDDIFGAGRGLGYISQFPLGTSSAPIIDDHVPFHNLGIPVFDLIIKFWDTGNGWPYHHTQDDTIENIDQSSLDITGKTLIKFAEDNFIDTQSPYFDNEEDDSNQNTNDSNIWDNYAFRYVVILASTIVIFLISFTQYQKRKFRKKYNLDKSEEDTDVNQGIKGPTEEDG